MLLYSDADTTSATKMSIASVIAHEFAHHWLVFWYLLLLGIVIYLFFLLGLVISQLASGGCVF